MAQAARAGTTSGHLKRWVGAIGTGINEYMCPYIGYILQICLDGIVASI